METRAFSKFAGESDLGFSSEAIARIQKTFGLIRTLDSETSKQQRGQNGRRRSRVHDTIERTNAKAAYARRPIETDSANNNNSSNSPADDGRRLPTRHQTALGYKIESYLWFGVFYFGSFLGDNPFYFTFFPFWFYNINACVIRRVILLWTTTMYIGQAAKEILKWPRPQSPPVVPLEPRYFKEYGMPSTHAMVGTLIPFSILYLTMDKVQYSVPLGFIAATAWMLLVCFSRLYRGMHYILDVIVGAVLTFALMGVLFPFLDRIDEYLIEDRQAPLVLSGVITFLSVTYPSQRGISSTREDTIVILSTTGTIYTSLWLNHHFQIHPGIYECALPDTIQWPSLAQCGAMFLREVVGVVTTVLAYVILRPIVLETISFVYSIEINPETRKWLSVEFPYKYVTYTLVGFACLLGSPYVFTFLGIDK